MLKLPPELGLERYCMQRTYLNLQKLKLILLLVSLFFFSKAIRICYFVYDRVMHYPPGSILLFDVEFIGKASSVRPHSQGICP